jgi:Cdc6-like AAA superfamily ATPase
MVSSRNPLQIQVAKHEQWETAQSKHASGVLSPNPTRLLITGPSGSGKTQLVIDLLTRIQAGCYQRIFVFSPSVHLDSVWQIAKDYVYKTMGVDENEKCFFDTWDEDALHEIIQTQKSIVQYQKKEKSTRRLYGIALVVDDFADSPSVMSSRAGGSVLNELLVRGRHSQISTYILSQRLRAMGSLLRVNAVGLVVFRLRNRLELDAIIEELSAVYDKKTLMEMYTLATAEPYSFWYVNLAASKIEDMFWLRLEQRMLPTHDAAALNSLEE